MPSKNNKPVLVKDPVAKRDFQYRVGDVWLNFTARTDVKIELKAFRDILVEAIKDIDAEPIMQK